MIYTLESQKAEVIFEYSIALITTGSQEDKVPILKSCQFLKSLVLKEMFPQQQKLKPLVQTWL